MNNETQKEIKNWKLKRLRKKYGLTQQDLADFLNISRTAYQYLESKGNLTSDILVRLSHFFGIDISEIVADEDIERGYHLLDYLSIQDIDTQFLKY